MLEAPDFKQKQILFFYPMKGDKLSFKNDNIVVRDADGKIKYQSTCYLLFCLFVVGHTSITTGLIQRAKRFGFSICLMTYSMKVYEVIGTRAEGNTILRRNQYQYDAYDIGKKLIQNKIHNQIVNLQLLRKKTEDVKETISLLEEHEKNVWECEDAVTSIMGIEGSASRAYFPRIFNNVKWEGRRPRIKSDYVNAILDIGYNVLFNFIESLLNIYGFDIYCGVLHRCFFMRKSLVCDLVEPFRAIIDYQVRKGINLKQFQEKDFDCRNNQWILKREKSAEYVAIMMNVILEYKVEIFYYVQAYYRAFMKQKDIGQYPFFEMK